MAKYRSILVGERHGEHFGVRYRVKVAKPAYGGGPYVLEIVIGDNMLIESPEIEPAALDPLAVADAGEAEAMRIIKEQHDRDRR